MQLIESEQNPKFKVWQSLKTSKGIKKHNLCLISGEKYIPEIWPLIKEGAQVLCHEQPQVSHLEADSKQVFVLAKKLYKELNPFNSNSPLIVAPTPELEAWKHNVDPKGIELLLGLSDPSNLGAALRSAEAFGVTQVILLKEAANPFHTKAIKASSGSVFRLKLTKGPSINEVNENCISLDKSGTALSEYTWPENLRLLVGEEGQGVPDKLKRNSPLIKIPMAEAVESLSAPIATSLALHSYRSQYKS